MDKCKWRRQGLPADSTVVLLQHSGPTEVEDCSLPPPNMAATKTGEQGKAWFGYYNHHTLTQVYTQIDMGRRNSVPENRDLQSLNFVTRTLCIFGGRWRTQRCEVEDSVCLGFGGGGLQFPMHASIDLSRYILYVEEFLIGHKLSFFWPDINTH